MEQSVRATSAAQPDRQRPIGASSGLRCQEQLQQLLFQQNVLVLIHYIYESRLKYIKCISLITGTQFLIRVSASLNIEPPNPTTHQITLKSIKNPLIVDPSAGYEFTTNLGGGAAEQYSDIYLSTAQPLHAQIYSMITRLGKCFKHLNYRLTIDTGTILCEMRPDLLLDWFTTSCTTFCKDVVQWFVTIPLDQFYKEQSNIHSVLEQVELELGRILEHSHLVHHKYITSAIKDTLNHYNTLSQTISKIQQTKDAYITSLTKLNRREQHLRLKMEDLTAARRTEAPSLEGKLVITISNAEKLLAQTSTLRLKLVKQICTLDEDLKNKLLIRDENMYRLRFYLL